MLRDMTADCMASFIPETISFSLRYSETPAKIINKIELWLWLKEIYCLSFLLIYLSF